jgi:hypothetical protein
MKNLLVTSEIIPSDLNIKYADAINIRDHINDSYKNLYESLGIDDQIYDFIYGFGNKEAIDFTKFISKKLNTNFILIPTVLEYDNIFNNKIVDIHDNYNQIKNIKEPLKILIDDNLLKQNSYKNHSSGWACIIASLTACHTWRNYPHYFNVEYDGEIDFEINSCISKVSCPNNEENRRELINTMKVFSDIGDTFQTSIHKESAEHYFLYNLKNYVNIDCLFGEALALSILVIAQIINPGLAKRAQYLMKKSGIECYLPSKKIILSTLTTLRDFVEENNFNYSIINTKKFYLTDLNKTIDKVYLMALDLNHNNKYIIC